MLKLTFKLIFKNKFLITLQLENHLKAFQKVMIIVTIIMIRKNLLLFKKKTKYIIDRRIGPKIRYYRPKSENIINF